jgi:nitrogen-specific signal transduction histidine kinase/ActR/RegA family two-component response regulator
MEEEKINLQEMLHQARKMEAIGTLAGGVAHDFNNMLQVIIGHAHLSLEDNSLPSMLRESLVEIEKAARRSATLTKQLLGFARKQTVKHEVLNLNETISEILNMLRRLIGENIKFDWIPGKDLWNIKMDSSQVDQILANLTVNGRDAIKGTGRISIETYNSVIDRFLCSEHPEYVPGDYAVIAVSDTGRGMDKESLSHIFEPFYTTKGPGKGTGLGLATVYGIVKQNNGFINVYSEPEHGTTFKIYLPRTLENMIKTKDAGETILKRGSETILMVEDELAILLLGKTMLEQFGYKVITAGNPETACQAAMKCKDEIKLLITDVVMPEMNGKQMLEKIRAICPDVKAMYMSGYTANVIAHQGILEENVAFIQKPFSMHELSKKVREALDNS